MKKLVVFTGAGVSAESGIPTFRDADGLWEQHAVEDIATPRGLVNNRKLVLDFYNERKRRLKDVQPNAAHRALVELEQHFDVTIITQNVDDLHERAGSSKVIHLHGELTKARDELGDIVELDGDIPLESNLRPHIVFFTEMIYNMEEAVAVTQQADLFVVIGSSLQVYPAAELPTCVRPGTRVVIIDPDCSAFELHGNEMWDLITAPATEGVRLLVDRLLT